MAFTTRHWAIRKLDMSYGNVDTAQNHLIEIGIKYETYHPEVYETVSTIVAALESIKNALSAYKEGF